MKEYDSCIGCQYYNKPYWSVVSPCASCPKIYNTGYINTTTVTVGNNNQSDYSTQTTTIPSAKEYREAANKLAYQFTAEWSEPKYQCPECGGGMCRNEMVVLTSYPAQYEYQCDKCGHVEYQYV